MKRFGKIQPWRIQSWRILVCALLALVGESAAPGDELVGDGDRGAVTARDEPILLVPAVPDPERRARLAAWWRHLEAARPALSVVTLRLRRERERWREGSAREGCRTARQALREVDSATLRRGVDYRITVEIGRALDEFDDAAVACLERRYFEFDYRLQAAEAALAAARERAAAQLARAVE